MRLSRLLLNTDPRSRLRRGLAAGVLGLLAALTACGGGDDDGGFACTLEFRPALLVKPVDGQGQVLQDVHIHWRVDAGPQQSQLCATTPCAVYDRAGHYELMASKRGHASASARLRVVQGRCHLQTESWRPALGLQ